MEELPIAGKDSGRVLHVGHLVDDGELHVLLLHHGAQALALLALQQRGTLVNIRTVTIKIIKTFCIIRKTLQS